MILSSRADLFRLEIPKVMIPKEVSDKWMPYIQRMPLPTTDVPALINWTVQSVSVPNFNYDPVTQVKPGYAPNARGTVRKFRGSLSQELLFDRKVEVTFKLLDGYWNYWVMMETFFHHYAHENPQPFAVNLPLRILDAEGNVMYSVIFHDSLFTEVGKFDLSYSEVTADHQTFTCTFDFNEVSYVFETA